MRCPNLQYLTVNLVIGWGSGISATIPPALEIPVAHRMFQEVVFHAGGVERYLTDELVQDLPAFILSVFPRLKEFVGYDWDNSLNSLKPIRGKAGWIAVQDAIGEISAETYYPRIQRLFNK
ncbi:hypothetical protein BD626DRAFT_507771, partial [Schizophyllum amplum]